jgi:hypothetical protein
MVHKLIRKWSYSDIVLMVAVAQVGIKSDYAPFAGPAAPLRMLRVAPCLRKLVVILQMKKYN